MRNVGGALSRTGRLLWLLLGLEVTGQLLTQGLLHLLLLALDGAVPAATAALPGRLPLVAVTLSWPASPRAAAHYACRLCLGCLLCCLPPCRGQPGCLHGRSAGAGQCMRHLSLFSCFPLLLIACAAIAVWRGGVASQQ